jgi:hypothetical protein
MSIAVKLNATDRALSNPTHRVRPVGGEYCALVRLTLRSTIDGELVERTTWTTGPTAKIALHRWRREFPLMARDLARYETVTPKGDAA